MFKTGEKFTNNSNQEYEIIECLGDNNLSRQNRYKVRFKQSGGERIVYENTIRSGSVKDPCHGLLAD